MKYAHLEESTNKLLGWYDKKIHLDIPTPNIKVDKKVWQVAIDINANCYENKKFIFKDFRTDEEIEIARIQAIKQKASELINSKYPDYKQLNIIRAGGAELEAMCAYIDSIREISNQAEQDGIKVEDVQWL